MTGSFERFDGSRDSMTHYFEVTRARAIEREWEISTDFDEGGARSRSHFLEEVHQDTEGMDTDNSSTWIDCDQMD